MEINAYSYIKAIDPSRTVEQVLRALGGLHGVGFVNPLAGEYLALVSITFQEPEGIPELQDLLTMDFPNAGVRSHNTVTGLEASTDPANIAQPLWPKRRSPPLAALVRIRVEKGMGRQVLDAVREVPGFQAAAAVAGDFDILLELGGESFEEFRDTLLGPLQEVEGVASTSTSFASIVDYAYGEQEAGK